MIKSWIAEVMERLHLNGIKGEKEGANEYLFVRCLNGTAPFPPVLFHGLQSLPSDGDKIPVLIYNAHGGVQDSVVLMRWQDFYKMFAWYFAARRELGETKNGR